MKLVSALVALVALVARSTSFVLAGVFAGGLAGCAVQSGAPSESAQQTGESIIKPHGAGPGGVVPGIVCPAAQAASLDQQAPATYFELSVDINGFCATIRYSDATGLYTMAPFTDSHHPGLCLYAGGSQLPATPEEGSMVCPINQQGLPWGYSHDGAPPSGHHDSHTTCHGCSNIATPQ